VVSIRPATTKDAWFRQQMCPLRRIGGPARRLRTDVVIDPVTRRIVGFPLAT
jgi:hypothetical protein